MISKRPIPLRRPNRLSLLPVIALRRRRQRREHQNRPPLRHRSLARSRVGVLHRNLLKRLILAVCHTRVTRTNHPAEAVRTIRHRRVATEVHVQEIVEYTCHVEWDADGEVIAVGIVGKLPTTRLVRSVAVLGVVAAETTAVGQEITVQDMAEATTVARTITDLLHRIIRWAAIRALALTTRALLLGNSLTHGNRPTRPR